MYRIYTLALRLGLTVALPYFLIQRKYWPTLLDRRGRLTIPPLRSSIWIHAVSVGEVKAVERLIERIREYSIGTAIVVSTSTTTGQKLAQQRRDIIDHTFYLPLDTPGVIARTLD